MIFRIYLVSGLEPTFLIGFMEKCESLSISKKSGANQSITLAMNRNHSECSNAYRWKNNYNFRNCWKHNNNSNKQCIIIYLKCDYERTSKGKTHVETDHVIEYTVYSATHSSQCFAENPNEFAIEWICVELKFRCINLYLLTASKCASKDKARTKITYHGINSLHLLAFVVRALRVFCCCLSISIKLPNTRSSFNNFCVCVIESQSSEILAHFKLQIHWKETV